MLEIRALWATSREREGEGGLTLLDVKPGACAPQRSRARLVDEVHTCPASISDYYWLFRLQFI